jgi:peptide/nickel transport system substrate-binding protein
MAAFDGKAQDAREALARLNAKRIGRRGFVGGVGASAAAIGFGGRALAQEGGFQPSEPQATLEAGQVITSISREDYAQQLFAEFPMEEGVDGGQLIIGESSDIATTNAILANDSPTFFVIGMLFESLCGVSVIDGSIVPGIAASYEIAADGVTYTFNIDPAAVFHDGNPVTAEDVKFSYDSVLNPESTSLYASSLMETLASYRVVDEHTFEIVSLFPNAVFFYNAVTPIPIVPRHIWESVPIAEWAADGGSTGQDPSRVIGSGAFTFVEWIQGDHITLAKNPNYYDTVTGRVPYVDEVIFRILPDLNTAVQELIVGGIDLLETVAAEQTADVQNTEGRDVQIYDVFDFTFYIPNLNPERTPLFQEVVARQALFLALDKQGIVDNIYAGFGEPALGTQAILSSAYAPEAYDETWEYDPERAAQMLEDAGWVDSDGDGVRERDGQKFAFTMKLPDGSATGTLLAAYFQEAWAEIGVECTPELIPFQTMLEQMDARDFDMVLLGFSWDPSGDQGPMFSCAAQEGGFNYAAYCNEEYDALQEQQLRELDPAARRELLIQQSQIVWEEQPYGIFRFAVGRTGVNIDRVRNFRANGYGFVWSLPWTYLVEE